MLPSHLYEFLLLQRDLTAPSSASIGRIELAELIQLKLLFCHQPELAELQRLSRVQLVLCSSHPASAVDDGSTNGFHLPGCS